MAETCALALAALEEEVVEFPEGASDGARRREVTGASICDMTGCCKRCRSICRYYAYAVSSGDNRLRDGMKVSRRSVSVSRPNSGSNQVRKKLRGRPLKYNGNRVKAAKRYMKIEREKEGKSRRKLSITC